MYRKTSFYRIAATLLLIATLTGRSKAQFDIEDSRTTASLRGIHNVGGGVAWASGSNGTVLRTEDGGYLWQTCNIPPGAEKLDFRGIQAFDENTAIVMSSGKGDLSRLYKTTDGCQTWKLLFTNPDKEGFWDALQFRDRASGYLLGDPVDGQFQLWRTTTEGKEWNREKKSNLLTADPHLQGAFAASNSSLDIGRLRGGFLTFGAGGRAGAYVYEVKDISVDCPREESIHECATYNEPTNDWRKSSTPISGGSEGAGIFSVVMREQPFGVIVGGDYKNPNDPKATAAFTINGGKTWLPAQTPPHGYRSSVAYDSTQKLWITVGPNGTDISRDDGKNWTPLTPSGYDPPDADKTWNALSLPFVVGPHGRIGRLRTITQK